MESAHIPSIDGSAAPGGRARPAAGAVTGYGYPLVRSRDVRAPGPGAPGYSDSGPVQDHRAI